MNRKMIGSMVGRILVAEAAMLLLPFAVALIYHESKAANAFALTAAASVLVGFFLWRFCKVKDSTIYAREGFVLVTLAWLVVPVVGAFPFVIAGEIPDYVDALFETVSGFTTTGASILTDVEAMSRGMLFWRSFTHWIGGMGVLVFILAIAPGVSEHSIHIMRAEMPGPTVGKLVPRSRDTASILYKIYIVMTAVEILLLWAGDMSFFESVVHTFGTAGTGGFGIKADSLAGYSAYAQWVITVFMILFGVNFNIYYLLLIRRFRAVSHSTELWAYLGIVAVSVAAITWNIRDLFSYSEGLRHAAFQVASIISTTGYATTDFDLWPQLSRTILFLLMFTGACAGSTCGGLKISRVVILGKMISRELRSMFHPRSVSTVSMEGKTLDGATLNSVSTYLATYTACIVLIFLVLSLEREFSFETNLTATVSCFNNIGPGLAGVGPASNYSAYSPLSKLVLSVGMLLGRLEIYPLLLTFRLNGTKH